MINNDNNIILYLQMRMSTKLIADFISFNSSNLFLYGYIYAGIESY
jgi:hypothetical protein